MDRAGGEGITTKAGLLLDTVAPPVVGDGDEDDAETEVDVGCFKIPEGGPLLIWLDEEGFFLLLVVVVVVVVGFFLLTTVSSSSSV